eukprot:m.43942 g.43942  ORF g.43942 m.43942 type:complete len:497 (-) comp12978_c0_seq1:24-1514(-)
MPKTADKAVDTSDLSIDPSTKPVLPPLGEGDVTWRRVLAYQQAAALADDMERTSQEPKSFLRSYLRPWLLQWVVHSSMTTVQTFQSLCGVIPASADADKTEDALSSESKIYETYQDPNEPLSRRAFSLLMSFLANLGASLGGEIFSITAFPFVFWTIDQQLGRFIIYIWVFSMYVGQSLKDYFHLPRPGVVNKYVRGLEGHWILEYGFPSTHTMSVMGQACVIVYYTYTKDYADQSKDYPLLLAIFLALIVVVVTAFGRVYLGVHSIPDLVGGFFFEVGQHRDSYAVATGHAAVNALSLRLWCGRFALIRCMQSILFAIFTHYATVVDEFITSDPGTLYIPTIVTVASLVLYPKPTKWTNAYGDTSMIAGVGHGVVLGSYLARQRGYPEIPLPWIGYSFVAWFTIALARALVGFVLLVGTRTVAKEATLALLLRFLPASELPPRQRYAVGVPLKFITYSLVGVVCVLYGPPLFDTLMLNSETVQAIDAMYFGRSNV